MKRSDLLTVMLGMASAVLFFGLNVLPEFEPADLSEVPRADVWEEHYEIRVPVEGGGFRTEQRTRTARCCVPGPGRGRIMTPEEVAAGRQQLREMSMLPQEYMD